MELGIRVVRGPDWQWRNQDDGEGHIGTLVEIGRAGSKTSPENTVVVQWDSGSRTNYRIGYHEKYDLRIFDNATIGVRHPNVICDNCKKRGIQGMRWKCTKCFDFDLCTYCYMAEKHDLTHQFMRFETSSSQGQLIPKRAGSAKVAAKGIFKNAIVVRGSDWEWQDQDGGAGKTGKVLELRGWDRESGSSVACVQWHTTGMTNVYRVGHKGKVDLKYIQEGSGGYYYKDHLPILGMNEGKNLPCETADATSSQTNNISESYTQISNGNSSSENTNNLNIFNPIEPVANDTQLSIKPPDTVSISTANSSSNAQSTVLNQFSVGDKVKIVLNVESFRQMQEGHGGWNQKMAELIGKIGVIHRLTEKGDVRVQFDGPDNRWTIYPGALTKLACSFSIGDYVRITNDEEVVRNLQKGHGEWSENMKMILGKVCRITTIYGDGDLRVSFNGMGFTLNSACCSSVSKHQADIHNTIAFHNMEEATLRLQIANQFKDMIEDNTKVIIPESPDQLVRDSAHGNLQIVKDIINKFPNIIDQKSSGKTALQVSCHQGHIDIVKFLISSKANLEIQDNEGDTALHYSCFGNQPDIAELLIQKNTNVNMANKNGCTPLHVAVNKLYANCVKVLLKYKCDVNIQDSYGDTSLHDIIGKEISKDSKQIIELLLSVPSINLSVRNKRGFNTLHHASLKGNYMATEKLIAYSPQLVDIKKDDGFSAFHLAALNGHKEVVKCLLQSRADKEILNNRRQTPLLLAVAQLHSCIIELLVEKKANVNAFDEDGDTCLHLLLNEKSNYDTNGQLSKQVCGSGEDLKDSKHLSMIAQNIPEEFSNNLRLIIASYLIQNGANLHAKNKHQVSSIDYVNDLRIIEFLNKQFLLLQPQASIEISQTDQTNSVQAKKDKCKLCDEEACSITFSPCQHKIVCLDCSIRLKRCIECNQAIQEKLTDNGNALNLSKNDFTKLLNKIQALEEAQICSICMERKKDTAFQCGHIACSACAMPLKACHICREKVIKKFKIYET